MQERLFTNQFLPGNLVDEIPYEVTKEAQSIIKEPVKMIDMLKNNIGRNAIIYMSYPHAVEWRNQRYEGKITEIGIDYLILYSNTNNHRYILQFQYFDYLEFIQVI